MDYAELVASKSTVNSIRGWLNWDIAPATSILSEAESLIYAKLRVPQMEKLDSDSIALNASSLELPSDFISAKSFTRQGQTKGEITVLDRQHFEERLPLDDTGAFIAAPPRTCTIYGDPSVAYFDTKADQIIPYRLLYYAKPAALSGSNTTNWLTRDYPFVLRATCMFFGSLFKKEFSASNIWAPLAANLLDAVNGNGDLAQAIVQMEFFTRQSGD